MKILWKQKELDMDIGVQLMELLLMGQIFGNDVPIFKGTISGNSLFFIIFFIYILFISFNTVIKCLLLHSELSHQNGKQ